MKTLGMKMIGAVRDSDNITEPSPLKLHIKEDKKLRTFIGGFLSIGIKCYVLFVAFKWAA